MTREVEYPRRVASHPKRATIPLADIGALKHSRYRTWGAYALVKGHRALRVSRSAPPSDTLATIARGRRPGRLYSSADPLGCRRWIWRPGPGFRPAGGAASLYSDIVPSLTRCVYRKWSVLGVNLGEIRCTFLPRGERHGDASMRRGKAIRTRNVAA
jgi:hypothetical protein